MALTGKLTADFESFYAACQQAEVRLKGVEAGGGKVEASVTKMAQTSTGAMSSMAGQLTALFSVGAVVQFGNEVLAAGDQIQKMADQTGMSTTEVQKLSYVASQSGSSMETLVSAAQNLQVKLGNGDDGVSGAMKRLGINTKDFLALGTYDQMTTLATAVQGIASPTDQASAAAALFGKTWKEILPAIKGGMEDVGNQAPIMSEATVQSLDAIGDAMARSKTQAIAWGGALVTAIEQAGYNAGQALSTLSTEHFGRTNDEMIKLAAEMNDPTGIKAAFATLKPPVMAVGETLHAVSLTTEEYRGIEDGLTASVKASTAAFEKQAALQDHIFGKDLIAKAAEYAAALGSIDNVGKLTTASQAELNTVMGAAVAALNASGQGASAAAAEYDKLRLATTDWAAINATLTTQGADLFASMNQKRGLATQATLTGLMNERDGLTETGLAWLGTGETSEEVNAQMLADIAKIHPAAAASASGLKTEYSSAFGAIVAAADSAFDRLQARIVTLNTDADRNLQRGGIAAEYGLGQRGLATQLATKGLSFAQGGSGDFGSGTLAMLHGKETITPLGKGSGATINASIAINVSGGNGAEAGRQAADALLERLKAKGIRL